VLEVFKKFDADGSGAISRGELGEVLQSLKESDPWEDEDIDEILAAADSSGDGELQIQEFVKWIFAEDKEISQGIKHKATMKISGCSRTGYDGDYVQKEGEYYYRRPIFYCEEQKKFLFYHGQRKQWSLFWRTGAKASCRLKTSRTAHMPGEGATWAVWKKNGKNGKKKSFVREPDMKCEAEVAEVPEQEQENPEELLQQSEQCVKFDEIYYKRIDGVVGNRAVYRQSKGDDWGDSYLFYEKSDSKWKMASEATEGASALHISRITKEASPEKAAWFDERGKLDVVAIDTDGIPNSTGQRLTLNRNVPDGWKDESFPHHKDSIGGKCSAKVGRLRWLRGMALHENPVLFADVEPADALQGSVGNCWLIAAMSAIAEFPSYLKNNIFLNKKISKEGKYHVKLFDGRFGQWKVIMVDDYLPCSAYGGDRPRLIFGKINDGKLCLPLIEKAFAKLYGSYSALWSGFQPVAWYHLTGCDNFFQYKFQYEQAVRWVVKADEGIPVYSDRRRATKLGVLAGGSHFYEKQRIGGWVKIAKVDGDGPTSGWIMYYNKGQRVASRDPVYPPRYYFMHVFVKPATVMGGIKGESTSKVSGWTQAFQTRISKFVSKEGAWYDLLKFDKDNHLMAAIATQSSDESDSGLVHGHAYSVLKIVEVQGFRLVACRNPWGSDAEWNGPWSDRSAEWRANPSVAKALNVDFQTEGTFWMDYEDWMYTMGNIKVMNCKMPTSRGDFHSQFVDEDEDGDRDEGDNDFDEEDDSGGGDIWITPPRSGGKIIACSGLGVNWNAPVLMRNGTQLQPGDTEQKFVNVPTCLDGGTYFGHPASVSPGFWNIEFEPPTTLYVWLLDGSTNSLELVMPTQGWTVVNAPGFQTNDGYKLHLLSKYIEEEDRYTGRYECFRTISSYFCGGLVGTYPLPKEPEVMVSAAVPSVSEGADFPVTACSGLEIDWNPPTTMSEGTLTNPGEEELAFQNVPEVLLGGTYIGTKCWPSSGTWTIEYQAPCKLYVWARGDEYNAGVDELLSGDAWAREAADGFQRSDGPALHLWGRHFTTGSSYSITVESQLISGVVGQPLELGGEVTSCAGLDIDWNAPRMMTEGTLVNPGDRDYIFEKLPPFLAGGLYIGSRTWPKAGTWTIHYQAPTILYVWVEKGDYNGGVDDALRADGWICEDVGGFQRANAAGSNPLGVWSRHFVAGSSYSIETTGLMVGGVVSAAADE